MDTSDLPLRPVGLAIGYALFGLLGTAVLSLGALFVLGEATATQRVVYHATYLLVGPSEATNFAVLVHFVLSGAVAIALSALAAEYVSDRGENARAFGVAIGAVTLLVLLFVVVSLVVEPGVLFAFLWVLAVAVVVPPLLQFGYGVRSGGTPAFVGGVPVLVLLMLLASVGLGWGGGHVVTAEEVPAGSVEGEVASFEDVPEFRDDLFADRNCEQTVDDGRRCRLVLRGYIREETAARFMDRHGVRCPHRTGGGVGEAGWFVARHDGTYYRVTCSAFGD